MKNRSEVIDKEKAYCFCLGCEYSYEESYAIIELVIMFRFIENDQSFLSFSGHTIS